jgi:hypothetical protein
VLERTVFETLVQVLVFGCAYHRIADKSCSVATLRRRRDEWIDAGVMDALRKTALGAYDPTIGLKLADVVAVDCYVSKAPCGEHKPGGPGKAKESSVRRQWMAVASYAAGFVRLRVQYHYVVAEELVYNLCLNAFDKQVAQYQELYANGLQRRIEPTHRSGQPPRSRRQRSKDPSKSSASFPDGPSIPTCGLPRGGRPSG